MLIAPLFLFLPRSVAQAVSRLCPVLCPGAGSAFLPIGLALQVLLSGCAAPDSGGQDALSPPPALSSAFPSHSLSSSTSGRSGEAAARLAPAQTPAAFPPRLQRRIVLGGIRPAALAQGPTDPDAQSHLANALAATGAFTLQLRPDIGPLAGEEGLGPWRQALAGADALLVGALEDIPPSATRPAPVSLATTPLLRLTLRAFDPFTGQRLLTVTSAREAATRGEALALAAADAARSLEARWSEQPWQAQVLQLEGAGGGAGVGAGVGARLRLSAGEPQGLVPGMTLEVQTQGDRVRSRSSGLLLVLPGRSLGRVRIEADGSARLVSGSLAGLSPGELVVRLPTASPASPAPSVFSLPQQPPRTSP